MPAYAAQRRGSRRGGSRAAANPEDDAEMAVPPAELTIQVKLKSCRTSTCRLVEKGGHEVFDAWPSER